MGPGLNLRHSFYLIKDTINPWPLNGTGFYTRNNFFLSDQNFEGKRIHIIYIIIILYTNQTTIKKSIYNKLFDQCIQCDLFTMKNDSRQSNHKV